MKTLFLRKLFSKFNLSDFKKHCYISGKSGSGKSELMKSLFYRLQRKSQKKRKKSLVLLDPHWDLAKSVKNFHINTKHDRVIYVDPYLKTGYTPTINPFQILDKNEYTIEITSQYLVQVFQELIPDSIFSNQMEALLYPCISVLLSKGNCSLEDLQVFMNDELNYEFVEFWKKSANTTHSQFFTHEFYNPIYKKTKSSLAVKIQSLLNSSTFYNLITGESTVHFEQAIEEWKIIIFNLAKGKMGVEASEVFGRFLIAIIQSIAQKRVHQSWKRRKDTFLFIDEFQNYVSPSIELILKETRKFGLYLVLANQTLWDIRQSTILYNLLNNTEVKLIWRNGVETLSKLSKEIGIKLDKLQKMKKFRFYMKSGDKTPVLIKTVSALSSRLFKLKNDEITDLNTYQINKYYKQISEMDFQKTPISTFENTPKAKFKL